MANYYGASRTNYFRVKDETKFREWASGRNVEVIEDTSHDGKGRFCLLPIGCDDDTFQNYDNNTDPEVDMLAEISKHLAPGSVCVMMESGHEKLRYIIGWAEAINHRGKRVSVNLQDIFKLARKARLGKEITDCEY